MPQRIQIRRGTAAQWTAANPVLAVGELAGETDTGKAKLGNGSGAWNSLPYIGGGSTVTVDADGSLVVNGTTVELVTDAALTTALTGKADANAVVLLTGSQTAGGAKTFSAPVTVATPTAAGHAATKAYVDTATPLLRASNGSPATGKRLVVTLTADGTDIADLTIEGA